MKQQNYEVYAVEPMNRGTVFNRLIGHTTFDLLCACKYNVLLINHIYLLLKKNQWAV